MYRERSWLDSRLAVRTSPIAGRGLFAEAPFEAGEIAAVIGGQLVTDAELAGMAEHSSTAIGRGRNLLQAPADPLRFGNHSCDPNLWLADEVTLVTRRPVVRGEELTSDYATMTGFPDWQMHCHCRNQQCRGLIRGTDWQLPELQALYAGHFSPFLGARIAEPRR